MVLRTLFSSLSDSILGHVLSSKTAHQLWTSLSSMFSSQSHAKEFEVRFQLTNLSHRDQSISEYFGKVHLLADSLAATGSPLSDKDLVTYLLNGLGPSYEIFVTSITTRPTPVSFHELYQLLLIHESCLTHSTRPINSSLEPSVNYTASTRDQRGRGTSRGGRQGRSRGRYPYNGHGGQPPYPSNSYSGDTSLFLNSSTFLLKNILNVPSITKSLVSVLQFCVDNSCYFEFHSTHFCVMISIIFLLLQPFHCLLQLTLVNTLLRINGTKDLGTHL